MADGTDFGKLYCGDTHLLQRFLFYAGIPYLPATNEERLAHYHANMQQALSSGSLFYASFNIDSAGMSRAVLGWRDALVGVGWNVKSYQGESEKLALIRDVEPEHMPRGEADYWYELLQLSAKRRLLPEDTDIVVTQGEGEIKPHIAYILAKQCELGVKVCYSPIKECFSEGNLGKIQQMLLDAKADRKISLAPNDKTFCYMRFATEDDALRYVATAPVEQDTLYYCAKPKRFDNMLKLLGKPTIGSLLRTASPQVVQLFLLGNGLFEYPLNMQRIIEWLNMPISPLDRGLRSRLSHALISSGGVNNNEWDQAKNDCLTAVEDEKERKRLAQQYKHYVPIPESPMLDVASVKKFNENLRKWATKLLAMDTFPYDEIVRGQIATIQQYCQSLIKMLDCAPAHFSYLDLQLWCKSIAQPGTYVQYGAELGCHNTISSMGDIHEPADKIVWFTAEDEGPSAYPFEMLNESEYLEAEHYGAKLYKRELHSRFRQSAMARIVLNARNLTIIEAEKSNGEKVARHPLVLQLDECIEGGLKKIVQRPEISDEYMDTDNQVCNRVGDATVVQLEDGVRLKERHERYEEEEKRPESYSSVDGLIQHPFNYVCEKCARLDDHLMPSVQDLNRTLGNVAHLMIEKVFTMESVEEAIQFYQTKYDTIFEEAVNEKGLLLRSPEYGIELRRLKLKMKEALRKLAEAIMANRLSVQACEYEFKPCSWHEAGTGVALGSRADMLLADSDGGKVILDFKYSSSGKYYKEMIEENRALQLELYRFMAKQKFGEDTPVRVAYVLLPDVTILTADDLEGADTISRKSERASIDIMSEAANSYRYRWGQLKAGRIERVEGQPVGSGEYGSEQAENGLFPLNNYKNLYSEDKFDKGYKSLK